MTKKECSEFVLKSIRETFESSGWKKKNTHNTDINFEKKNADGNIFGMYMSFIDYNPIYITRFAFYLQHKNILNICSEIGKSIELSPLITNETMTLAFGFSSFNDILNDQYMPRMKTEEEFNLSCNKVIEFTLNEAFPFLEKMNDLKMVNKEVNSSESFWTHDISKKFNFGGNDMIKRLIIAKLVGGNSHLEEVVEGFIAVFQKPNSYVVGIKSESELRKIYSDQNNAIGFTINYLKSLPDLNNKL